MGLDDLQQRLENHFAALLKQRTVTVGKQPVFALEHGLSAEELAQLHVEIHSHIAAGSPAKQHALPWIVYAAEMGYRYSGDEYWQTFEKETPRWTLFGSRTWIRRRFEEFHARFGGAKPTGRWAEWFTNICWPITHAILPKDLQRQLAKILYENRHAFSRELFDVPERLGALIAARSLNASTRFRKLAQQPLLLGQIATALLLEDREDAKSLILSSTLRRIATDLERERQSKAWLSGARQHVTATRLRAQGGIPRAVVPGAPATSEQDVHPAQTELGLEPRMIAKPTGAKTFDLCAEIPNLAPLLIRFPELSDILNGSRCIVAGAASAPLWKGRVLRGMQLVRLATWPAANEPLFKFERSHPKLDYVLSAESFRRPGDQWLFRIATDGLAYEMRSLNVSAGGNYLLLRTNPFAGPIEEVDVVAFNCAGVHGLQFSVPSVVTDAWTQRLKTLGLNHAKTFEIWPAGTPPAAWDGEARVEWLTTDSPMLGVRSDHPLEDMAVLIDGDEWSRVQFGRVPAGKTHFLEFSDLPAGLHRVSFRLQASDRRLGHETIHLSVVIREPHEWTSGVTEQGAFIVLSDPPTPTLEQLWEGRAAVEIHGPNGRQVSGSFMLSERGTEQPLTQVVLPPLQLPATGLQWEQYFGKHVRGNKVVASCYDMAQVCVVELNAEELGHFRLECERAFEPVRWALRRGPECYHAKVVSDRGEDKSLSVVYHAIAHPESVDALDAAADGYDVPLAGGLYTATADDFTRSILVPPFQIRKLQDLEVKTEIDIEDLSVVHLLELLAAAELWASARMAGADLLASIQIRDRVVDALLRAIASGIAGSSWCSEEQIYRRRSDPGALPRLCEAIATRNPEKGFASIIERDIAAFAELVVPERVSRLNTLCGKFLGVWSAWLVEFALRLSSGCVREWAAANLQKGITELQQRPILMRAARAVVLGVDARITQAAHDVGPVYAGWKWE